MKLFTLAALAFASATQAFAAPQLGQGEVSSYAQIIAVESNHMFPVETITMTVLQPCGARLLGPVVKATGEQQAEVGVLMAYRPAMMVCLAMPMPVKVVANINSELPVDVKFLNLRLDLNRDNQ